MWGLFLKPIVYWWFYIGDSDVSLNFIIILVLKFGFLSVGFRRKVLSRNPSNFSRSFRRDSCKI